MGIDLLSKENSKILRGLGIMAIMLHNLMILPEFGLSSCNEMSFSIGKTMAFWDSLGNGRPFAELLSFLGWAGVPVFIFLTGYGTAISAPPSVLGPKSRYIKRCWLKLVLLLVPMLIVFGTIDVFHHHYQDLLKRASYLTLLQNLAYPWIKCTPGSYWYFSVTFQYYLLWILAGKYLNKRNLVLWSIILLAGLWALCMAGSSELLSVYRHSFTGWFFVFAFGVYMAMYHRSFFQTFETRWWQEILIVIILSVFSVFMNMTLESWLFVPLIALILFFALGLFVMRIKLLAMAFRWIGGLSASIFVCHAFVKGVIKDIGFRYTDNMLILVAAYVVLTLFFAVVYEKLYRFLLAYFKVK